MRTHLDGCTFFERLASGQARTKALSAGIDQAVIIENGAETPWANLAKATAEFKQLLRWVIL